MTFWLETFLKKEDARRIYLSKALQQRQIEFAARVANKKQLLCSSANNYLGLLGRVDCSRNHNLQWTLESSIVQTIEMRTNYCIVAADNFQIEGQPSIRAPSVICFGLDNLLREGVAA